MKSARFVTGIRDRLSRYLTQDYPAQLALAAKLAVPPAKTGGQPGDKTPPVRYTPASSLCPQCDLPFIATEADLDQWLAALRTTAQAELKKRKSHKLLNQHNKHIMQDTLEECIMRNRCVEHVIPQTTPTGLHRNRHGGTS